MCEKCGIKLRWKSVLNKLELLGAKAEQQRGRVMWAKANPACLQISIWNCGIFSSERFKSWVQFYLTVLKRGSSLPLQSAVRCWLRGCGFIWWWILINQSIPLWFLSVFIAPALGRPSERSYLAPDLLLSADNYPTVLQEGKKGNDTM